MSEEERLPRSFPMKPRPKLLPRPVPTRRSVFCSGAVLEPFLPQETRRYESRRTLLISGAGQIGNGGELTFHLSGKELFISSCGNSNYWEGRYGDH
jgi:hypothetical protein